MRNVLNTLVKPTLILNVPDLPAIPGLKSFSPFTTLMEIKAPSQRTAHYFLKFGQKETIDLLADVTFQLSFKSVIINNTRYKLFHLDASEYKLIASQDELVLDLLQRKLDPIEVRSVNVTIQGLDSTTNTKVPIHVHQREDDKIHYIIEIDLKINTTITIENVLPGTYLVAAPVIKLKNGSSYRPRLNEILVVEDIPGTKPSDKNTVYELTYSPEVPTANKNVNSDNTDRRESKLRCQLM